MLSRLHRGELVDRDLEVEASRVRPRGLAVQLAALDEDDLDALPRQVVGEGAAGEAAADDQHVGTRRERCSERREREPAAHGIDVTGRVVVSHRG